MEKEHSSVNGRVNGNAVAPSRRELEQWRWFLRICLRDTLDSNSIQT